MNFFENLEKSLEILLERTFLGRLGGKVQPVEVAKGIWREIIVNKRVSLKGTYVPNYFIVTLSRADYEHMEVIFSTVEEEIIEYIKKETIKREYAFVGPPLITWMGAEGLNDGQFFISSDFLTMEQIPEEMKGKVKEKKAQEGEKEREFNPVETIVKRRSPIPEAAALEREKPLKPVQKKSMLMVLEGYDRGKEFELVKDNVLLGRSDECDLIIGDPGVSGKHARIYRLNGDYVIEDEKSRKGTHVNEVKTDRAVLKDGDRIRINITVLEYHALQGEM